MASPRPRQRPRRANQPQLATPTRSPGRAGATGRAHAERLREPSLHRRRRDLPARRRGPSRALRNDRPAVLGHQLEQLTHDPSRLLTPPELDGLYMILHQRKSSMLGPNPTRTILGRIAPQPSRSTASFATPTTTSDNARQRRQRALDNGPTGARMGRRPPAQRPPAGLHG